VKPGARAVKTTAYFERRMLDRPDIQREWVEHVVRHPLQRQRQRDGRIRCWGYIAEKDMYLRVVVLEDGETVHNAFFDRDFVERL
jgi:hypothetical protein